MNPILVIGGGISGVTAAVELAEAGKEVIIVERSSHLGGNVVRMHNYFPKLCPPACGMEINFRRIRNNSRIKVLTHSEVQSVEGTEGAFKVRIGTRPQRINDLCTACGDCATVCPETMPDIFNYQHGTTKAVYLPHPLAFPQKYEIDTNHCLGVSCNKCVEACNYQAIDLTAGPKETEVEVHALIAATGWKHYNPANLEGLGDVGCKDVVTNVEFERLLSYTGPGKGKLLRPSDGKPPASVAFVQCAGSRDINHLPYCSAVCCSASLKHALNISEQLPDTKVTIFYIDLRVLGRNEDFLNRVEAIQNIHLTKGKVAKAEWNEKTNKTVVVAEDIASGRKIREEFDMLVLATGIVPESNVPGFAVNEAGFMNGNQQRGFYPAACVKKPMDVSASVKDATAAAVKAMKNQQ